MGQVKTPEEKRRERLKKATAVHLARRRSAEEGWLELGEVVPLQEYLDNPDAVDMSQWDNVVSIRRHPRWKWHR